MYCLETDTRNGNSILTHSLGFAAGFDVGASLGPTYSNAPNVRDLQGPEACFDLSLAFGGITDCSFNHNERAYFQESFALSVGFKGGLAFEISDTTVANTRSLHNQAIESILQVLWKISTI